MTTAVALASAVTILASLLQICDGVTLDVSRVPCAQDGSPSAVPSLRFRYDRRQSPSHHVTLRVNDDDAAAAAASGCLCATSYRFIAKVTRRPAASDPVQIEVCLTDFQLFDDRLVLKRFHVPSGRKTTIIAFDGEGTHGPHCELVTLQYREVVEMRVKIRSSCQNQRSESGSRFNATFRYITEQVTCPRPPSLANGTVLPTNRTSFQAGEFVQYACDKNHSAVESNRWFSECNKDGQWTQPPPRCATKDDWCPRVALTIPHAIVSVPVSRSVDSVLRVTCTDGYYLHGLPHYTCLEEGTWSSAGLMQHIVCSNQSNCPIPENDDVIVRGHGIYPGSFATHCCRPGLEQYGCGAGLVCDACTPQYCTADQKRWTASSPQCRTVQPLWTRLYNSLFRSAMDMNASLALSQQRCGGHHHADGAGPTEQATESTSERQVGVPLSIECSRSVVDLRACFDLAFLLDASLSIADDVFYNASLPFVRVVTNYFSIGPNRTRVSVLLFEEDSDFILEQETKSKRVYHALSNISRPAMGNTNLRGGFEKFVTRVALDVYNGSSSYRRQCKKVMFVLSDGNINDGGSPAAAASQLKQLGWEIYSIGIGEQGGGNRLAAAFHSISSRPHYEYIFQLKHGLGSRGQCGFRRPCRNQPPHVVRSNQQQRIEDFVQELLPGQSDYSQCGRTDTPLTAFTGRARILGGTEARFGAYPWQVALIDKESGKVFCSGTLVCNGACKWVLTAAHCFFEGGNTRGATRRLPHQVLLRFGENDLTILEGSEFECGVRAIYHRNYDGWPANGNDVALLEPDCSFELTARRRCACLPTAADMPLMADGRTVEIAGWGAQKSDGNIRSTSHVLQWVKLRMVGRGACEKDRKLKESMVCAAGLAAETDSCRGDSGGSLISRRANDSYVALAVLSYGQVDPSAPDVVCGRPGYYGIYTSVLPYMDWIREKFKLTAGCHPHLDDDV